MRPNQSSLALVYAAFFESKSIIKFNLESPLETCGNFCYSTPLMITAENKAQAFALTQTHKTDVGSPQAQVSVLTSRIKEVTEHLKLNKHDHMARRGLVQMVGRRKRLLKYLEAKDFEAYKAVVAKLGLRK